MSRLLTKTPSEVRSLAFPTGHHRQRNRRKAHSIAGAVTGVLIGCDDSGRWLVDFPGNTSGHAQSAQTTVPLGAKEIGKSVILVFEHGDPARPVIVGVLQTPALPTRVGSVEVEVDGHFVTVSAHQELVLRCGKASITLTRAGKILLRGTYLLSRSSGVNSIKGGSIQIN